MTCARGAMLLLLVSCAEASEVPGVHFAVPWALPLARSNCFATEAQFEDRLVVTLRIGGHDDCPLTLDTDTLEVSGNCPEITVGVVRPLTMVWELEPPLSGPGSGEPRAQLAYHITYVDLKRASLADGQSSVSVSFVNDGESGVVLYHREQLWWIPGHQGRDCVTPSDCDEPAETCGGEGRCVLADACAVQQDCPQGWVCDVLSGACSFDPASELGEAMSIAELSMEGDDLPLLNRDGDQGDVCPNLVEACQGILYDDDINVTTCLNADPPEPP